MKKFLPYILILTIIVQLFAPFSVTRGVKNNLKIENNKVEAENEAEKCKIIKESFTSPNPLPTSETPRPEKITYSLETTGCKGKGVALSVRAQGGVGMAIPFVTDYKEILSDNFSFTLKPGEKYCSGSDCNEVRISVTIRELVGDIPLASKISADFLTYKCLPGNCSDEINWELLGAEGLKTDSQNFNEIKEAGEKAKDNSGFPACSLWSPSTYGGCIGIVLYWLLFKSTSLIFGLAGKILDFTLMYSIADTSYRSGFVVQGWGIVRDFCNMFFIFVLLYIAFGTILGLHNVKTKEMIINVVIIGILINFSLFATQVIIDASNILTRVFYNQNTIVTGIKDPTTGVIKNELGEFGEIKLSEAIVSKVNPQKLVIEAQKVSGIKQSGIPNEDIPKGISAGSFIIVVILATIVNIVGIIAFLSAGLIFIARVIGLWLAMIVSPLVFFSYTVPALQDMEMIGWKKWWPETLKLAFLAPVFAFFMYLVVGFMDKGMGVIDASYQDGVGLGFLVAIIVPFIFVMILLMKAKDIAKDMSGKIGQQITSGVAAMGGIALGGAALGVAALGRGTIGSFMKGASTRDTAARRLAAERISGVRDPSIRNIDRFKGTLQRYSGVDWAQQRVGARLNANQHEIQHATHSRHLLDNAAGVVAPGKKWEELNGEERTLARTNIERDRYVRENRNTAGTPLANLGTRNWDNMTTIERDYVNTEIAAALAAQTTDADINLVRPARRKVGLGENIIQSTVGGSFDLRNISQIIAREQDKGLNKFATGLTAALASGMRGIIKQSNINYGQGQKDFVKDLGNTITEALKSTTLKVDLSHVGEEKKEGDHGGGGHH
jgi:hypothetical protein